MRKAPIFSIREVSERIFAAGLQKLSTQLEVNKPARKIVLNNQ